jgi:NAD(P) transhydrogenase subunit alpha
MVTIGVPREPERRVALVPDVVKRLVALGAEVWVEPGAGDGALIGDERFAAAGARITDEAWEADVVLKVAPPAPVELDRLRPGAILIGLLGARAAAECERRGVTAFALEAIPRSSRAQAMDVLSSPATGRCWWPPSISPGCCR